MRVDFDVVAIKDPGLGVRRKEYLQDIVITNGATYVTEEVDITLDSMTFVDMLRTVLLNVSSVPRKMLRHHHEWDSRGGH